ncbi:MAG: SpoIIE family protein phosphatase [Chitinophagaceae bacterium]
MVNAPHKSILMPNRTYQAMVRSEIKKIAQSIGFTTRRLAEVEIIVAEMTSNLSKHSTQGGQLLVKEIAGNQPSGIEIICIDNGPGMVMPARMLEDGVSTSNTLGQGLGAIRRLSDEFDLYSRKDWGTILLARVFVQKKQVSAGKKTMGVNVVMLAKTGEEACGDNWTTIRKGNQLKLALLDGLGHGPNAALAAEKGVEAFHQYGTDLPNEQLKNIHAAIRKTRGAVIGIAHIDFTNRQLLYSGVGNISGKLFSAGKLRPCMSYNGIVGHTIPGTINNYVFVWEKNDMLILHSDGLSGRWDLQKYPQITRHDGSILAAALYKDHCRGNDDVTIAVTRYLN